MKMFLAVAATSLALTSAVGQAATIYSADFSGSEGVTHTTNSPAPAGPIDGPNWTLSYPGPATDGSANFARAASDRFETEDWGGEATVLSDPIDVSLIDDVDLEWAGQTVGGSVFNAGAEYFEWIYSLDGGTPAVVSSTKDDGSLDRALTGLDVSGASSLAVGFRWNVNGGGDGFDIFGLTVEGESAIPEPAAATLACLMGLGLTLTRRRV